MPLTPTTILQVVANSSTSEYPVCVREMRVMLLYYFLYFLPVPVRRNERALCTPARMGPRLTEGVQSYCTSSFTACFPFEVILNVRGSRQMQ